MTPTGVKPLHYRKC